MSGEPAAKGPAAWIWEHHQSHPGDRHRLFAAIVDGFPVRKVLYPGSFVDIAPSFVFDSVTYVDVDAQASRFFNDTAGVNRIIADRRTHTSAGEWRFIHADYTDELDSLEGDFDLLVSLYAGFVSEHCTRYLRPGGLLLVNASHGDVAMTSLDSRYALEAVITLRSGTYAIGRENLEGYLLPKRAVAIDRESLRKRGRGIGYTKSPFAYIFRLVDK